MRIPRAPCVALVALLSLAALPAAPAEGGKDVYAFAFVVPSTSELATGLVALPSGPGPAQGVVAILHGYGHTSESHRVHLQAIADLGFVGYAMDYRGGGGMQLGAGAEETCAALDIVSTYAPGRPHFLYSVSMGSAVAGMVLAQCPRFLYWVNNEGMTSITETWAEASVLAPANAYAAQAKADIESECGGTPADAPTCYAARHALSRAPEFTGLQGIVQTHGVNDGLVPYNQGREMAAATRAVGIPTEFFTVVGCAAGDEGTTITGYVPVGALGGAGLAGHGTESNDEHCLTALSFGLLHDVLVGALVPTDSEHVVDGTLGTLP